MFRKNFRTVKTGIIFGILLLSLFVAFIPSTSAGLIIVDPLIYVTYPEQEEEIIPNSGVLDIPLSTTVRLSGPFAKFVKRCSLLGNAVLQIELKIVEIPDWCEASFSDPLVQLSLDPSEPFETTLTVTVNENAPAYTQGVVRISATSKLIRGLLFNIGEVAVEFDVSFIIGYWSVVSYELPYGNLIEIGPLDTADFEIDIQNIGNGPTLVSIGLLDYPEDEWDVNIASSVQLDSAADGGGRTSESVHLIITPSVDSDRNKVRQTFRVKFTPSYLGKPDLIGQEEIITFNVQKIGSLKEEEESDYNLLILLIVAVVLIILISIFLKRRDIN